MHSDWNLLHMNGVLEACLIYMTRDKSNFQGIWTEPYGS